MRTEAFQCISAIVIKKKPEPDMLNVIRQSGFLEEIRDANYELMNNYEDNRDTEEFEEEKGYMRAISTAVNAIGKWCVERSLPEKGKADPLPDPADREFFNLLS